MSNFYITVWPDLSIKARPHRKEPDKFTLTAGGLHPQAWWLRPSGLPMVRSLVWVGPIFKDPAIRVSDHHPAPRGGETARTKILLQPISAILTTGWRGARQKSSKIKDGFVIIIIGGFLVTQLWLDHAGNYIKVSHLASSRNPSERERL